MGFGKDGRGAIIRESRTQALGTLNNEVAIFIGSKLATTDDFRILKSEIFAFIGTLTSGEGPGLIFGLADGELSTGEIGAVINTDGPLGPNDIAVAQIAERPVFVLGQLDDLGASGIKGHFRSEGGGPKIVFNPRWTFAHTTSWNWFIFNNTGANLTTGATVRLVVKNYGVWVR